MSLELDGEILVHRDIQSVWGAINDPEVLKICIPGCQSLERTEEGHFAATVKTKLGPISLTFTGAVRIENPNPPHSFTLVGEGSGGVAGFAKGGAEIKLTEEDSNTRLTYSAKSQVGGKIAQLGVRLLKGTAEKLIGEFFDKLEVHFNDSTTAAA